MKLRIGKAVQDALAENGFVTEYVRSISDTGLNFRDSLTRRQLGGEWCGKSGTPRAVF